jgi:hypothetical protein
LRFPFPVRARNARRWFDFPLDVREPHREESLKVTD